MTIVRVFWNKKILPWMNWRDDWGRDPFMGLANISPVVKDTFGQRVEHCFLPSSVGQTERQTLKQVTGKYSFIHWWYSPVVRPKFYFISRSDLRSFFPPQNTSQSAMRHDGWHTTEDTLDTTSSPAVPPQLKSTRTLIIERDEPFVPLFNYSPTSYDAAHGTVIKLAATTSSSPPSFEAL